MRLGGLLALREPELGELEVGLAHLGEQLAQLVRRLRAPLLQPRLRREHVLAHALDEARLIVEVPDAQPLRLLRPVALVPALQRVVRLEPLLPQRAEQRLQQVEPRELRPRLLRGEQRVLLPRLERDARVLAPRHPQLHRRRAPAVGVGLEPLLLRPLDRHLQLDQLLHRHRARRVAVEQREDRRRVLAARREAEREQRALKLLLVHRAVAVDVPHRKELQQPRHVRRDRLDQFGRQLDRLDGLGARERRLARRPRLVVVHVAVAVHVDARQRLHAVDVVVERGLLARPQAKLALVGSWPRLGSSVGARRGGRRVRAAIDLVDDRVLVGLLLRRRVGAEPPHREASSPKEKYLALHGNLAANFVFFGAVNVH